MNSATTLIDSRSKFSSNNMNDRKRIVRTDDAPVPAGHYSQAVRVGHHIYVSGSGPFDPKSHAIVAEGIKEQTCRTLDNIAAILKAEACSLENVVKVTVFLKNMNDFKGMDAAYREYFKNDPPARTTVQAELYGKGRLIVIDAIAYVP